MKPPSCAWLAGTGLDGAVVMTFDGARAGTTAQDFINHDLIGRLGISGIAVGYDFHFGKGRAGSPSLLASEAPRLGIEVHIRAHVDILDRRCHRARSAWRWPKARSPRRPRCWARRGSFPAKSFTARSAAATWAIPPPTSASTRTGGLKHGIYAVRVGIGDKRFDGVASFGRRPTFDNGAPLLEIFLFDFKGDLYGQKLDIAFIGFIRDELKFDGIDALVHQMNDDSTKARAALAVAPDAFPKLGIVTN